MLKKDYYQILGVNKDSDLKQIKQSYRKLAMKFHPDKNPNNPEAEDLFKEAAEAYNILSNPEKRELYDRYGHEGLQGQSGFAGMDDIFSNLGDIFSDFFGNDIFGGSRRSTRPPKPPRGADLRYNMTISFKESITGAKKNIELTQHRECDKCKGTGSKLGTSPQTCPTCQGHGQVVQRTGFMTLATNCPTCQGGGSIITSPCSKCTGTGREKYTRSVSVNVPAGVDTGMRLRLAGEGEKPQIGDSGDLYIFIEVEPHETLHREGNDLITEVSISYIKAILGHKLKIKLIDDTVEISIPAGIQPGEVIQVSDKGVPYVGRAGRGDLLISVTVKIPKKTNKKERDLLKKLDK